MANQEHVDILLSGVDNWNEFVKRKKLENPDELFMADLEEADLEEAILPKVNLEFANLQKAKLVGAKLVGAKLQGANLHQADLHQADLQKADLDGADLRMVDFYRTKLMKANLQGANLQGAGLEIADLFGADLWIANLQEADLRGCKNYRLDTNYIKDTIFSPNANDPWSVLRRKYTGVMLFFNFLFLIIFLGSNTLQAFAWKGINVMQTHYAKSAPKGQEMSSILNETRDCVTESMSKIIEAFNIQPQPSACMAETKPEVQKLLEHSIPTSPCMADKCDDPRPIWQIMLGLQKGWWMAALAVLLIVYNIARVLFTWWIGLLRDAEERSNHSPSLKQYIWWHRGHFWFMCPMVFCAVTSVLVHGYDLLFKTTVILPLN